MSIGGGDSGGAPGGGMGGGRLIVKNLPAKVRFFLCHRGSSYAVCKSYLQRCSAFRSFSLVGISWYNHAIDAAFAMILSWNILMEYHIKVLILI